MNEAQSLDALAKVLNDLSERPYDLNLHKQHVQLARSLEGMEAEATSACEMLVDFLAAGDQVWNTLIEAKESSVDLETAEGVDELLSVYSRAESDYLSIPILQKHLQFLIDRHEQYAGEDPKPSALGDLFSTTWTRTAITEVVNKGLKHLTKSHVLWDLQRDWELQQLESVAPAEKSHLQDAIQVFFVGRLGEPHTDSEETLQYYSTFTTNHRPPGQYEPLLVTASKAHARALKSLERREPFEAALVKSGFSLEEYARYIAYERRARNPDLFVMVGVFERAIAEADKRRFSGEVGAEEALRMFWVGLSDVLRINHAGEDSEMDVFRRAVRSVPGYGEIWARYIRALERHALGAQISDVFNQAFGMGLIQSDVEQLVPVVLAHAGHQRRRAEDGTDASKTGDPKLRLEKYLAAIAQLTDAAINVWEVAAKFYKSSYLAWASLTDTLIKYQQYDRAEKTFLDIHAKNLDWPEAIWEAWLNFEQIYGSVDGLDQCLEKVEKAQYQVNIRRAKEAEKAGYEAMQAVVETQPIAPASTAPVQDEDVLMQVDTVAPRERGTKREAEDEDEPPAATSKRAKIEQQPPPLKRDRENSTVFVADLPAGITDEEVTELFKDMLTAAQCGRVREVKFTKLPKSIVATVEFFERDSVPAALTKDKKRLHDQEVAVHLAWKSTLYVTNFPESADDAVIRNLFSQYGTIFDVRWPSKKFKNTRRFCYVQYTSPASAENALELHGRELEPKQAMNVFLSNPERRKERTDQDANEREVYVAGLSKFTTQIDLDKLFKTYGAIKEIRMATDDKGHSKGFAFIEYEQEKDALAALDANNHELKKRRIAVTLADSRARARARNVVADSGLSQVADARTRSVRIHNLPAGTQEGLLQQTLEKLASVKRVEVFVELKEAVVELENTAVSEFKAVLAFIDWYHEQEAGKLLLRTDPIIFNGNTLKLSEEGRDGAVARSAAPPPKAGGLFVPRSAASRPRAGLGHTRKPAPKPSAPGAHNQPAAGPSGQGKGQDDFRKMLG
ncbi:hypothetical protein DXG01_015197 [Tephrocybe rancida]|nr:hypothetical protein DXG01_015197 [Tephrocybe rancida]